MGSCKRLEKGTTRGLGVTCSLSNPPGEVPQYDFLALFENVLK